MLKHSLLTVQRIQQFSDRFIPMIQSEEIQLPNVTVAGPVARIPYDQAKKLKFEKAKKPHELTPLWSTWWFKVTGTVPVPWRKKTVNFIFRTYSECLVWQNDEPVGGLNWDAQTPFKDEGRISIRLKNWDKNGHFELYVEASASGLFGQRNGAGTNDGGLNIFRFDKAALALVDLEAWKLYHDFFVPMNYLFLGGETSGNVWTRTADNFPLDAWRGYLMETLNEICNLVIPEDKSSWKLATPLLKKIYSHKNASFGHEISAIGHAHIDTAWLWPLEESVRKCSRTFSTAVAYMDDYPSYKIAVSQAHQYQWVKDRYPALYERIKDKVKKGQFVPVGGTWIEPDCVVPSGESLVRQFLYGKLFFRKEFGIDIKEFWNPDVFGYSGQLPQIIRGMGIEYFLTQKLSWNQFNKPKSQNFYWEGIDGSQVFTHFPPADTYNAMAGGRVIADLLHQGDKAMDHDRTNQGMLLYGYGDGGGGPTRHMLEVLDRVKDFQGIPRTVQRSAQDFFKRLKANIKDIPVIKGELYLEFHRGCYTTQAATKKGNRESELGLRAVEILSSLSTTPYPSEKLEQLWKLVLLNQFHDILPGSSINEVYLDNASDYAHVLGELKNLQLEKTQSLVNSKEGFTAINLCGWERSGLIRVPKTEIKNPLQLSHTGEALAEISVPSIGFAALGSKDYPSSSATLKETKGVFTLENEKILATFFKGGQLSRLYLKKEKREIIEKGELANQFVLFDDRPTKYDAWEVEPFHLETRRTIPDATSVKILEKGPLRVGLEFLTSLIIPVSLKKYFSKMKALSLHLKMISIGMSDISFSKWSFQSTCILKRLVMRFNSVI